MFEGTDERGFKWYGTEYSGKCAIVESSDKTWRVYAEEEYLDATDEANALADSFGVCLWGNDDEAKKIRRFYENDLAGMCSGVFKTRREAREYVESIGRTW